jgi:hypothetical protein
MEPQMADHTPEKEMPAREMASPDDGDRLFSDARIELVGSDGGSVFNWELPDESVAVSRVTVFGRKANGQLVRYLIELLDGNLSLSKDE